jgi:sulfoxide reductase heme-binding subunit YedZ
VVLPFTNETDPYGIGAGVIALELMIAVALSVLIQKWMGFHRWRRCTRRCYAAYTLMTGHVLVSGAETGGLLVTGLVLLPWLIVVLLWMTGSAGGARVFAERISRRRTPQTSIQVDPMHCARFGFCEQEAPEIFSLRGDGQLAYHAVVSDEKLDAAVRAARACPARAIALAQGGAGDHRVIPLRMVAPSEPPVSPAPRSWPPNDHSYPRNGRR